MMHKAVNLNQYQGFSSKQESRRGSMASNVKANAYQSIVIESADQNKLEDALHNLTFGVLVTSPDKNQDCNCINSYSNTEIFVK
jgi:hypothetical protein